MKIHPGILVITGNYTQKQFDCLGRIWDELQRSPSSTEKSLPCIQLSEKGNIGVVQFLPNGEIKMQSLFPYKPTGSETTSNNCTITINDRKCDVITDSDGNIIIGNESDNKA